ncbi:MAG: alanine racemase [Bacteroidales bacterium]|jgi:alanine racemase|nr:alanine racemase [Bacteroidales bacterium]
MNTSSDTFAQLELSKSAIINNYNYFRSKLSPSTKLLILVKANAYGHGASDFAKIMQQVGADYLAVAHPVEGAELRRNGISLPIMVLTTGTDYYDMMIDMRLEPGIPDMESIKKFHESVLKKGIKQYPVHIALDTGMHRLGFMENEIAELEKFLPAHTEIRVKSLYSHLCADDEKQHDAFTENQVLLFDRMSAELKKKLPYKPMLHILNSAGIERFPQYQKDMVRLGIGIYGISATGSKDLLPAASLTCKILQIKHVDAGETIGYGRNGRLKYQSNVIATLPLGYADGIDRRLGCGNAEFLVNGHMAPTIGNICMDMCMIDITGIDASEGDKVTIFGKDPTASGLAERLGTIPYEIFTSVDRRVKRVITE